MKDFKLGIIQNAAKGDKDFNLKNMEELVTKAAEKGAEVIALPEMWNCPYQNSYFEKFKEEEGGKSYELMVKLAREHRIFLVGGSIPIASGYRIYNKSFVFNREGREIFSYSKINLFDIEGFKESKNISGGKSLGVFENDYGLNGLCICYDSRFPELFQTFVDFGAEVIFMPSTFMIKTGKRFWELVNRARGMDTQCYLISPSIARDDELSKNAYAHSMITSPYGEVLLDMGTEEGFEVFEIKGDLVREARKNFPYKESRSNRSL
ncbi:nitrilase-related carbon-nitrogen hydrolase [Peptoniphilus raoultii]|uniref:nitrilase-related carbon-nitrogen hydrolase n=1 Tax=Peptoniphilus raoultii TaxID=1776387 RepID=UPI0008D9A265|nr:nitrilase-related carbon-nitrogen hydrolase [Peptoniphilus raoultii]